MNDQVMMCPSAPWNAPDARVFGVVAGSVDAPEVHYLKETMVPTAELVAKLDGVNPAEVFRATAPCAQSACSHHDSKEQKCTLATRIVASVPIKFIGRTSCAIRSSCVWWAQEGSEACKRCPQIATRMSAKVIDPRLSEAATPPDLEAAAAHG